MMQNGRHSHQKLNTMKAQVSLLKHSDSKLKTPANDVKTPIVTLIYRSMSIPGTFPIDYLWAEASA